MSTMERIREISEAREVTAECAEDALRLAREMSDPTGYSLRLVGGIRAGSWALFFHRLGWDWNWVVEPQSAAYKKIQRIVRTRLTEQI